MIFPLAIISLLVGNALAHLQLMDPLPIKSPLNSAVPNDDKDYSYTAPLISNGLPFPCKGYLESDASLRKSQKSWPAGTTQAFTIAPPGAVHGGGSCQLSLSYDMGATWNVIFSYIGGCMAEDLTNSFQIPSAAPSGEAVFAWSWFNRLGNREMYHNCAIVTVTNGGSGLNSRDHPAPFVANAGNVNTCTTIENQDVVFPNPGAAVKYSGEYKGATPAAGRGILGSGCSSPGGADGAGTKSSGGTAPASSSAAVQAPASSSTPATSTPVTSSSTPVSPPSSSSAAPFTPSSVVTPVLAAPAPSSPVLHSPVSAAPASTTSKARTCKRRRSVVARNLISVEEMKAHKERRVRRHAGWGTRRMDSETRSGRVAALPAQRPVYKD